MMKPAKNVVPQAIDTSEPRTKFVQRLGLEKSPKTSRALGNEPKTSIISKHSCDDKSIVKSNTSKKFANLKMSPAKTKPTGMVGAGT